MHLVIALFVAQANCSGETGNQSPEQICIDYKRTIDQQSVELKAREQKIEEQRKDLIEFDAQLKVCITELASVKEKLQEYVKSPAGVYEGIRRDSESAATVADVDGVLARIVAFKSRFPTAPENKGLKKLERSQKKMRKMHAKNEAEAKARAATEELRNLLSGVSDGNELAVPQLIQVANHLQQNDIKYDAISKLPRGSFLEAMKDPDSERGKGVTLRGRVIQISKDGEYFTGLLCADTWCNKVYHFVTPGTTKGVVANKRARFAGVISQRYSYSNVRGGTTHSIALVGYFKGQD